MGKFFAALIILGIAGWLGPMCARLPADLSAVSVAVPPAPPPAPAVSTAAVAAPAAAPAPDPAPAAKPASDKPAVIVIAYGMKKMFPITDGRGRVSVRLLNTSEQKAVDMSLTMTAHREGKEDERSSVNTAFSVEPGTSAYRGLFVSTDALDTMLAAPPVKGAELRWVLTYRLEGDAPETKRCYHLRALPRTREPEGIAWTQLGSSAACATR